MNNQPPFPPRLRRREHSDNGDCKIEIKKTKTGKKILIGKGCTKDQIQLFKETGDLNPNEVNHDE